LGGAVQALKFWTLTLLLRALALLPWPVLEALGWVLGHILWLLNTRTRHITEINMAHCLPELSAAERHNLARASLVDFGQTALEIAKVWFAPPPSAVSAIVAVEGEHLLRSALDDGRGVMVLAPHHGNWEMLGLYLGRYYGLTTMYLPSKDPALDTLIRSVRMRGGADVAPANSSGIRIVLKVLKQGGLIGMLPDQVPKQAGAEFAPFFGKPALTMTLGNNLLQKTGARALFACALRVGRGGGFRIVFSEPDPELYSADLQQSLAALNRGVEAIARQCPHQYQWEYKRFKAQPEGYPRLY
jgi:Kdo2-lipid IVA lauroyltransferase/acyltransferase